MVPYRAGDGRRWLRAGGEAVSDCEVKRLGRSRGRQDHTRVIRRQHPAMEGHRSPSRESPSYVAISSEGQPANPEPRIRRQVPR